MNTRIKSLLYSSIISIIIVIIFLGLLSSIYNPVSWVLIGVLVLIPQIYKRVSGSRTREVKWKDEYSVGIDHIDLDHKKLIVLLNRFTTAYDYAMSEEFEKESLEELVKYTVYHFNQEEKLMEDNNYPDLAEHKAQHSKMIDKVNKLIEQYNEEGHDSLNEISSFLSDWLINHINGSDKEYGRYLNDRGIH